MIYEIIYIIGLFPIEYHRLLVKGKKIMKLKGFQNAFKPKNLYKKLTKVNKHFSLLLQHLTHSLMSN